MADADHVETDHVVPMPERAPLPLPDVFHVDQSQPLRFTPRQMRFLAAQTGRPFTELLVAEGPVVIAYFQMLREGWPNLRYADLEDVAIEIGESQAADPLSVPPLTGWPSSAGSGG